jgi:hypothetical protein
MHYSTSTGFTPSSSTLLGKIYGGKGLLVATELAYNTDYYFKFVAVDINKRATASSTQATSRVTPLVDADLIAAELNSPLSFWPFATKTVTAGALADGAINGSEVFGSEVIPATAIAALSIGANQIAADAITTGKIEAGAITSAKIAALTIEAGNIKANTITANQIAAGTITATQISSSYIYAGSISANQISGGTITGIVLQSAAFGQRVVINSSTLDFYNFDGNYSGRIFGGGGQGVIAESQDGNTDLTITNFGAGLFKISGGYVGIDSSGTTIGANETRTFFQDPNIQMPFITTATAAANMRWGTTSNGRLFYIASARRAKYDIQDAEVNLEALNLRPRTWFDMNEYIENGNSTEGLVRVPGFVAEEVLEAGLEEFVTYDAEGVVQGLSYDRMVAAIVPVVKHLNQEIEELKTQISILKGE